MKTRLALEVVEEILNREDSRTKNEPSVSADGFIPDDVYFVPLQPLISSEHVLPVINDAVGVQFYTNTEPRQQLIDYLRSKALLLVLDNFEHLLSGLNLVAGILAHSPHIKILITSRETLNLQEEWVYRITGMDYPQHEDDPDLESYGAIRLFM